MLLCHCRGVNDRKVRKAIDDGARTIQELGEVCAAGTRCGGCWPALAELLSERTGQPLEHAYRIRSAVA